MNDVVSNTSEVGTVAAPLLSDRTRARFESKPSAEDWRDDEPMELAVAVALHLTAGLSEKGLRTAIRNRELACAEVSGRLFVTKRALREMFEPKLAPPAVAMSVPAAPEQTKSEVRSVIEDQLEWEHAAHKRKNSRRRRFN